MSEFFSDENDLYKFQNLSKWQGPKKKMSSKYFTGTTVDKNLKFKPFLNFKMLVY